MAKLTTGDLKLMINGWLSTANVKADLREHHMRDGEAQGEVDREAAWWKLPPGTSIAVVREAIWQAWCDGSQWKRASKRRLGDEADTYFYDHSVGDMTFMEDFCGNQDVVLIRGLSADRSRIPQCWLRVFVPNNELADNFRLEVVTTPEDDAVVGWSVVAD